MRRLAHSTLAAQKHALVGEVFSDFTVGTRVATVDGYPGRITAVLDGPFPGTEGYEVILDGGIGGGQYSARQLRPLASHTAAQSADDGMSAEAATLHLAAEDYPELSDILHDRPPNERVKVYASRRTALPTDLPGQSSTPESGQMQKKDQAAEQLGRAIPQVEQVEPPDACSFCGHDQFENPTNTGRGTRMECAQCGGTMTSWGGQWQPDPPSSPENAASRQGDPRATINDLSAVHGAYAPEDFGQNVMARYDLLGSNDPEARAVAVNPSADPRAFIDHFAAREQPVYDPDLGFHMLATWADVRRKAKAIKDSGGVRILAATGAGVVGEVQGEHHLYESSYNYVPGTRKVADWSCFLPDAPVTMADGTERPISEVQVGDRVITHLGNAQRVLRAAPKPYDGDLTTIKFRGDRRPVVATSSHEVWTPDGWREIGTLKPGDFLSTSTPQDEKPVVVAIPRPARRPVTSASGTRGVRLYSRPGYERWVFSVKEGGRAGARHVRYFVTQQEAVEYSDRYYAERDTVEIKLDLDLCAVLGWYAAEGFVRSSMVGYQVGFSLSADEYDVAERIDDIVWRYFGVRGHIRHIDNKIDYRVSDWRLHYLCTHLVGHRAAQKALHENMMTLPHDLQEAFVAAWINGDGHYEYGTNRITLSSVSETLIRQGRDLMARLGQVSTISWSDSNRGGLPTTQNAGRIFSLRWVPGAAPRAGQRRGDARIWRQIERVTATHYQGEVWDIEVAEDHSFRAYGIDVHNCGCKWGGYAWGRSPAYARFEGRQCFLPGTEVSLADGTRKPIELVQPGDRVLTHDGVGTVLNRWDNHYRGEVVGISRAGSPDVVWATADHGMVANIAPRAFLADLASTRTYRNRKVLSDKALWGKTSAGDLLPGDWLMGTYAAESSDLLRQWDVTSLSSSLVKQATGVEFVHVTAGGNNSIRTYRRGTVPLDLATPDFATLLGWYLAEGSVASFDRNGVPRIVEWTLHRDEVEYGDEVRALIRSLGCGEPKTYHSESIRKQTIKVSNSALALVLSHLAGAYAISKQLHPMVMTAGADFQRALLESYLKGDGCESKAGTASHALAKQIVTLGARISSYIPRMAMAVNNRGPRNRSKGGQFYSVETTGMFMQGRELLHDNYYAVRINKMERKQYHGPVYNLNVDYQHTYAVDDLVVFNCSHVTALQYEAQSRGMFGRQVQEDRDRLPGQYQRSPVTVQYDRAGDVNLNRRTVPPGNMRRTFSSLEQQSPDELDLAPVHAFACEMIRAQDDPDAILRMLAKHGVAQEAALQITAWAASVVGDEDGGSTQPGQDIPGLTTRDTTELKKKPHHHDHHTNDSRQHAPDFGRGIGWYAPGLMWCDQCSGSGCGHCGGTGQVMSGVTPTGGPGVGDLSTTTSPVGDESASAGEDTSGGISASSSLQLHQALLRQFTADYAVDSLGGSGMDQTYRPQTQHSNSQNPGSTGWATSADPGGWVHPIIGNDYGITSAASAERGTSDICGGCGEHIHATGDYVAPWVHSHTGNSFCDVQSTNDAAMLAGSPLHRPEAEPIMHEARFLSLDYVRELGRQYLAGHPEEAALADAWQARVDAHQASVEGQSSLPEYTHAGLALKAADTGRVLMIQRSIKDESDPARGTWEMPGGGKEPGDKSSLHTGVREWEEEVGHPFPEGGHVSHTWRSGTYHGHVVVIPSESQVQFAAGRSTVNPDDPGGDDHEQSAWWHPADAKKNPALREELKKNNPFGDIAKAAMGQAGPDYARLTYAAEPGYLAVHHPEHGEIGGVSFGHDQARNRIRIVDLFTSDEHRRRGVATQLMTELERRHPGAVIDHGTRGSDGHEWAQHKYGPQGLGEYDEEDGSWGSRDTRDGRVAAVSTPCQTPEVIYDTKINDRTVGVTAEMPMDINLDAQQAETLDRNLHNMMEMTLAPMFPPPYAPPHKATLREEPEPALPSTDGGVDDDPVPEAGVMGWTPGDPAPGQYLAAQPETPWGYPGGPSPAPLAAAEASFDDVPLTELVAAFQATAAGQQLVAEAQGADTSAEAQNENAQIAAMARAVLAGEVEVGENGISKSAMKDFSFAEQQELISEGAADGTRARNFDGLQIEGTHYALLGEDVPEEQLWL